MDQSSYNAGVCVRKGVHVYNTASTCTDYTLAFIAGDLHVTTYMWLIGSVCVCVCVTGSLCVQDTGLCGDRKGVCRFHRFS